MRTVIILSFLAILVASTAAYSGEPVGVGGDFGQEWLKNLPYHPTTSSEDGGGLWSWGGIPNGMVVVNKPLVPNGSDAAEIDYADVWWLWTQLQGSSLKANNSEGSLDFMYPFYSNDPWFFSRHYQIPILVPNDPYDSIW